MNIRIIIGFFLLFPYLGFSQGEFNNWCFGYNAGLTFNSGPPVVLPGVNMNCFGTGSSTVSDSLGNLLFYTNDMAINNRNNVLMPNGNIGLNGCGSGYVKNSVAFRQLNDLTKYFIFSGGCGSATNLSGLRYTVVDMTLDGGLGDVVNGLGNGPVPGASNAHWAVTGTRHNNNRDIWVVVRTRETGSNYYLSYLVNPSGINFTPVQSNSHIQLYTVPATSPVVRNIKISRDGTKMVAIYDTIMEFCSFNPTTGQVTPMFLAYLPLCGTRHVIPKSAEFSVKGKYLYVSGARNSNCGAQFGFLFQFDASKTDSVQFQNSAIQIMNEPTPPGLQLAPDGKIYCTTNGLDSLSAINNPSSQGIGCNYQRDVIGLQGSQSANALPDYIERYYAMIHATGLCPGEIASFSSTVWPPADSIHWDFGDLASGGSNFSNLPNPTHIYNTNGTYTVEMFVRHIDNRTDIIWKTISIVPGQQVNLGADRTVCTGDSTTFDAGVCTGCTYLWKKLPAGITVGTSRTFRTNQVGNYTAIVTNSNGCIGSDTVQLSNTSMPVVTNNPLSKSICSGQSTNISLTSNLPGTTFHWTATLTSGNVTGFSADSGLVINQILTNTFPVAGIVTYHITPKIASCSGNMVDFPVTVNPGDSVKVTITSSGNPVCAGTQVTFTATPSFGGTTPSYQWKVNGINKGTNNSVYTYTPNNGDVVKCILTSSFTQCVTNNPATSNTIQMVVNPNLPVSVSVSPSANPVCDGTSVTFTATPIHGGTTPSFQWKVNGINAGTNSSSYSYTPAKGDLVKCVLTSSEICTTYNPATSNQLTMVVRPNLVVGITISASVNPVCSGIPVTFTAIPTNGGTPPQYQWKVNGNNAGANNPVYTYSPASGDQVSCILTSNLTCITNNPASSNTITVITINSPIVTFILCFDSITTINAKPIKLKGGIPLGGTYSGPGVNSITGLFTPSTAGIGTKTMTYSYTNSALCSASKTKTIIVRAAPVFTCGSSLLDIRDGKIYPTVQIGSQCWMAADLNYGTEIPSTQHQRDNCIPEKYIRNASPVTSYSYYQWDEMMRYDDTPGLQGLCPAAWHVPAEAEWNTLFSVYTNNGFAGSPLKYSGYSGFNALLSGVNHFNRQWDFQNFATFFWSSTPYGPYKAWSHGMNDYNPSVSVYPSSRVNAFSIRCLQD